MANHTEQLERLREIAMPICLAHGLELVDARFVTERGAVLKVLIERPGEPDGRSGVTLADCQAVSRDLSTALDVEGEELPQGAYRLEVSSPGVERPLLRPADYERFAGREAKIKTVTPIDGRKSFTGVLRGVTDTDRGQAVRLELDGQELSIPIQSIAKAHLVFRF